MFTYEAENDPDEVLLVSLPLARGPACAGCQRSEGAAPAGTVGADGMAVAAADDEPPVASARLPIACALSRTVMVLILSHFCGWWESISRLFL